MHDKSPPDAATPYDAALAIEADLRTLPYSLDVPAPPKGREVVSWFLTDLRRGYCDYFASAMVVLARGRHTGPACRRLCAGRL